MGRVCCNQGKKTMPYEEEHARSHSQRPHSIWPRVTVTRLRLDWQLNVSWVWKSLGLQIYHFLQGWSQFATRGRQVRWRSYLIDRLAEVDWDLFRLDSSCSACDRLSKPVKTSALSLCRSAAWQKKKKDFFILLKLLIFCMENAKFKLPPSLRTIPSL